MLLTKILFSSVQRKDSIFPVWENNRFCKYVPQGIGRAGYFPTWKVNRRDFLSLFQWHDVDFFFILPVFIQLVDIWFKRRAYVIR